MELILASNSPRRKALLRQAGYHFTACPAQVDESSSFGLSPLDQVTYLAKLKARAVFTDHPQDLILGADTLVSFQGRAIGKPASEEEALAILKGLQGKTHQVMTGVCLLSADKEVVFYEKSQVTMAAWDQASLARYVKTGEPLDKAGAYGLQGRGALLLSSIEGDPYNVIGLPLHALSQKLREEFGREVFV